MTELRLVALDDFVDLWATHSGALPAAARAQHPLAPVHFLDRSECIVGRVSCAAA